VVTDGQRYAPLVPTRDHKRAFDGNLAEQTGGMGAYSTDELLRRAGQQIVDSIIEPTMRGLAGEESLPRVSVHWIDADWRRTKVLEFIAG